jgi:hypothetical protein
MDCGCKNCGSNTDAIDIPTAYDARILKIPIDDFGSDADTNEPIVITDEDPVPPTKKAKTKPTDNGKPKPKSAGSAAAVSAAAAADEDL